MQSMTKLAAARLRLVNVPVVAAARLKSHVGDVDPALAGHRV